MPALRELYEGLPGQSGYQEVSQLPTTVPVAYESIIDLSTIHYEEIDMGDGTGYRFLPTESKAYPALSAEDREILDAIIERFGRASKKEIVETMHREAAYAETAANDMIPFRYTTALSLS